MAGRYTRAQVRDRVLAMARAGASSDDIDSYVQIVRPHITDERSEPIDQSSEETASPPSREASDDLSEKPTDVGASSGPGFLDRQIAAAKRLRDMLFHEGEFDYRQNPDVMNAVGEMGKPMSERLMQAGEEQGRIAGLPAKVAGGVAGMVEHPIATATAPLESAVTLGRFVGEHVGPGATDAARRRETLAGRQRRVDALLRSANPPPLMAQTLSQIRDAEGPDVTPPVTGREAAIAGARVGALAVAPEIGERVGTAVAGEAAPLSARAYAGRAAGGATAGAIVGAPYTPEEPEVGAVTGALFGGASGLAQKQRVTMPVETNPERLIGDRPLRPAAPTATATVASPAPEETPALEMEPLSETFRRAQAELDQRRQRQAPERQVPEPQQAEEPAPAQPQSAKARDHIVFRVGPIEKDGADFARADEMPRPPAPSAVGYDLSDANIADATDSDVAHAVLDEALSAPDLTDDERTDAESLARRHRPELAAAPWVAAAAKRLGYDGIQFGTGAGEATAPLRIWAMSKVKPVPPVEFQRDTDPFLVKLGQREDVTPREKSRMRREYLDTAARLEAERAAGVEPGTLGHGPKASGAAGAAPTGRPAEPRARATGFGPRGTSGEPGAVRPPTVPAGEAGSGREAAVPTEAQPGREAEPLAQSAQPLAARASAPAIGGNAGEVFFSSGDKLKTQYQVVDAAKPGSLETSHNAETFEPNPQYPEGVQGRAYHGERGTAARQHVQTETGKLRPEVLLDAGSGVTDGPPLVTHHGIVVAGNQRAMMIKRAAATAPDVYARYRAELEKRAAQFGVAPGSIADMKAPVLVRRIADESVDVNNPAVLGEINRVSDQVPTKTKDQVSAAMSRAHAMEEAHGALTHLANTMDPESTVRDYIGTAPGREFVRELVRDGVIAPQELPQFVDAATNTVHATGRQAIEDMLFAAAIGDADTFARAPADVLRKLGSSIPALIAANHAGPYSLQPYLQDALGILSSAAAMREESGGGKRSVDDFLDQGDAFGREQSPASEDLARFMDKRSGGDIAKAMRVYARAALEAAEHSQSEDIFGAESETPERLRERVFRDPATRRIAEAIPRYGDKLPFPTREFAAVKLPDGKVVRGYYHDDARDKAHEAGYRGEELRHAVEGFVLRDGTFVDRQEAMRIIDAVRGGHAHGRFAVTEDIADTREKAGGVAEEEPSYETALTAEELREFERNVRKRYGLEDFSLSLQRSGDIKLDYIIVPKEGRSRGIGTKAMEDLTAFADRYGRRIILGLNQKGENGTTSRARLKRYYKRFGFVENKGRQKDFAIRESMYRKPSIGHVSEKDLFGYEPAPEHEQESMFGEKEGTTAARNLEQTERAARNELAKLRQQMDAKPSIIEQTRIARRIAELERLVNRDKKISADELRTRAAGGESNGVAERGPNYSGREPEDPRDIWRDFKRDMHGLWLDFTKNMKQIFGAGHEPTLEEIRARTKEIEAEGEGYRRQFDEVARQPRSVWLHLPREARVWIVRRAGLHDVVAQAAADKWWGEVPVGVQALVEPILQEAAQSVAPRNGVRERQPAYADRDRFYSRLERAIESAPFEKGTPEQWRAQLSKNVAKGEREWTNVDAFLDAHKDRAIAKAEIRAAFEKDRIRLEESVARSGPLPSEHHAALARKAEVAEQAHQAALANLSTAASDAIVPRETESFLTHFGNEQGLDAFHRTLSDYIKENVGHVEAGDLVPSDFVRRLGLFRHGSVRHGEFEPTVTAKLENLADEVVRSGSELRRARVALYSLAGNSAKWETYTEPGGENYREIKIQLGRPDQDALRLRQAAIERERDALPLSEGPRIDALNQEHDELTNALNASADRDFESGHFDEPNILVHARVKNRTLADGEKVLFIEELQSDWHERGREHGYKVQQQQDNSGTWPLGVPDAPFKRSEEWGKLALRRLLDEAVAGGYDRIGWTTGEQQAHRFDLSRQVRWIDWERTVRAGREDKVGITALPIDEPDTQSGHENAVHHFVAADALPNVVGKELSRRIMNEISQGKERGRIEGDGLRVGGHGIRAFYDEMIPRFMKEVGKELGVKLDVEPVNMGISRTIGDDEYLDLKPTLAELEDVMVRGDGIAAKAAHRVRQVFGYGESETPTPQPELLREAVSVLRPRDRAALAEAIGMQVSESQQTVKITPELRKAVEEKGLRVMERRPQYHMEGVESGGADVERTEEPGRRGEPRGRTGAAGAPDAAGRAGGLPDSRDLDREAGGASAGSDLQRGAGEGGEGGARGAGVPESHGAGDRVAPTDPREIYRQEMARRGLVLPKRVSSRAAPGVGGEPEYETSSPLGFDDEELASARAPEQPPLEYYAPEKQRERLRGTAAVDAKGNLLTLHYATASPADNPYLNPERFDYNAPHLQRPVVERKAPDPTHFGWDYEKARAALIASGRWTEQSLAERERSFAKSNWGPGPAGKRVKRPAARGIAALQAILEFEKHRQLNHPARATWHDEKWWARFAGLVHPPFVFNARFGLHLTPEPGPPSGARGVKLQHYPVYANIRRPLRLPDGGAEPWTYQTLRDALAASGAWTEKQIAHFEHTVADQQRYRPAMFGIKALESLITKRGRFDGLVYRTPSGKDAWVALKSEQIEPIGEKHALFGDRPKPQRSSGRVKEPSEGDRAQLSLIHADGSVTKASDLLEERHVAATTKQRSVIEQVVKSIRDLGLPESGERRRAIEAAAAVGIIDPRGRLIRSAEDAAQLMTAFRHPAMEIMHAFILDAESCVVDHVAHTSGMLSTSVVPTGWGTYLAERAKKVGGDRVVLAHNHPSGDPTASSDDMTTTHDVIDELHKAGTPFYGHVIIDHDEATWLTLGGRDYQSFKVERVRIPNPESASWRTAIEMKAPKVQGPHSVASYAQALVDRKAVSFLHLDTQHRIVAIEPRPVEATKDMDWLATSRRSHAAKSTIIVARDVLAAKLARLVAEGKQRGLEWAEPVLDVIGIDIPKDAENEKAAAKASTRYTSYVEKGVIKGFKEAETSRDFAIPLESPGPSATEQVERYDARRRGADTGAEGRVREAAGVPSVHGVAGTEHNEVKEGPPPEYGRGGEQDPEENVGSLADYEHLPTPKPAGFGSPSRVRPGVIRRAILSLFNPELLGPAAKGVATTIRAETALSFREIEIARETLRELGHRSGGVTRHAAVRLWDAAEKGLSTGDVAIDEGNRTLRRVSDARTQQLIRLDRLQAEATVANYLGRFWSVPGGHNIQDFLRVILARRPFEGPKSFLKERSWEFFTDGLRAIGDAQRRLAADAYPTSDAGDADRARDEWLSKVRPVTYNYVDSQLAKLAEMDRLIASEKIKRYEKQQGRAKPVMLDAEEPTTPDGRRWVLIDPSGRDPAFNVYGPRTGMVKLSPDAKEAGVKPGDVEVYGPRVVGRWFAHPDAAPVWHAHLSVGIRGHPLFGPLYQAYMAPANASVQLLLGFSGFHFMNIAREGINSRLALALDDLANEGNAGRAALHAGEALGAPAVDAVFGEKIMAQYRNPGAHPELERVLRVMVEGGFRGQAASEFWTGERIGALKKAWHEAIDAESTKVERAVGMAKLPADALWAVIETQMRPLMAHYVPWMKTAATYRAVAQMLEKLPPNYPTELLRTKSSDIVKEMDYRYGHVIYDNHFMNRVVKDLAQAIFLAPGWTFGWLTLGGRAVHDVSVLPERIVERVRRYRSRGKGAGAAEEAASEDMLGKSAAVIGAGLAFYMLVNGVLTYLHTDERPNGKDFFAYRDGTLDRNGNANRHVLPGAEMRDFYAWGSRPVQTAAHKLKPGLSFIYRYLTNRTYFGDLMYDPEAPLSTRAWQVLKEARKELATPISVQNYEEAKSRGGERTAGEVARSSLGISAAKREFQRTPAQNLMYDYLARSGKVAETPDKVVAANELRELRNNLRDARASGEKAQASGIIAQIRQARHDGDLTRRQMENVIRGSRTPALEAAFRQLQYEDAVKVYQAGEPWEQAAWYRLLHRKAIATGNMRDFRERHIAAPLKAANQ